MAIVGIIAVRREHKPMVVDQTAAKTRWHRNVLSIRLITGEMLILEGDARRFGVR